MSRSISHNLVSWCLPFPIGTHACCLWCSCFCLAVLRVWLAEQWCGSGQLIVIQCLSVLQLAWWCCFETQTCTAVAYAATNDISGLVRYKTRMIQQDLCIVSSFHHSIILGSNSHIFVFSWNTRGAVGLQAITTDEFKIFPCKAFEVMRRFKTLLRAQNFCKIYLLS